MRFRLLGPVSVWDDGEWIEIGAPMQRALLSLLLLRRNQPVPQDELIDQLWDGDAPRAARASLQNKIHLLRKILGPEVLERRPHGYVLHVAPEELDVDRFERLVVEARAGGPRERAAKLREALLCWCGPALLELRGQAFAQTEIARLEEQRLTALEERIDADLELGSHVELVAELEELVTTHPLRERFWTQLMLALYRAGRQADALGAYRRAHRVFSDELGIEPGVVLRELQRRILVQDPLLDDPQRRLGSTLERAAAILPRGPRERAESLYEYGGALLRIGERRQAASTLEAAIRAAAAAGEPGLEQRAKLSLSHLSIFTDGRTAEDHLEAVVEAVRVFDRLEDEGGLALACWHRAYLLWVTGHADEAVAVCREGIAHAVTAGDRFREAACRGTLAQSVATGSTHVVDAIGECENQLQADCWVAPEGPFVVLNALAFVQAQAGRLADARANIERALRFVREAGAGWNVVPVVFWAGVVEQVAGNLDEAENHYRAAHVMLEAENDRSFLGDTAAALGHVAALQGRVDEAREHAREARRIAHPGDFGIQIKCWRTLALVAAHEGDAREAQRLCADALESTAGSSVHGEILEDVATAREVLGDVAGSVTALREALPVFERKGNIVGAARVRGRLDASGVETRALS